jgi:hypothetical protein
VSPDGRFVFLADKQKKIFLCPVDGGAPVPVAGLSEGEYPIQWSPDARFLFTRRGGELHARIWRLEIATGKKELFREVAPSEPAGVTTIESLLVTPDGRSLAYGYVHNLSDLYVVSGLK